ncbi:MAG: CapA family protein [Oscillospiraceae bacterium]|jgi:poly-gamma-glutamate synthesis protein (capsule biosynthesis protein)|nr:CapA family protein [Oscillospiraceae bacterium]
MKKRFAAILICFILLAVSSSCLSFEVLEDLGEGTVDAPPIATDIADETDGTQDVPREPAREIIISAVGDVTLGGNMKGNPKSTIYSKEFAKQGEDYGFAFRNTRSVFEADDVTIANFEGTFTNSTKAGNSNSYNFRVAPEHVNVLTQGSVEMVTLENNHVLDFGQTGLSDTRDTLDSAGISWAYGDQFAHVNIGGFVVGMLAYQTFGGIHDQIIARLPEDIARARSACDFIVVYYHWGAEEDYYPNNNQIRLGRATIDAGADLVLGAHSHRINPIELYEGKYIVYSLSNFSFSGNVNPSDMRSFIFQCKVNTETAEVTDMRILPIRISSRSDTNDFCPTLLPPGSTAYKSTISDMIKYGAEKLKYGLTEYKTEWTN